MHIGLKPRPERSPHGPRTYYLRRRCTGISNSMTRDEREVNMFTRVSMGVAVPPYIKVAWDKMVPKKKHSITLAQMLAKYCKVVDPCKASKGAEGRELRFFTTEDGIKREATKEEVFSFFGNPADIDFEGMMLAERMVDAIEKNPLELNIKIIADDHLAKLLRENMYLPYDPRDHP